MDYRKCAVVSLGIISGVAYVAGEITVEVGTWAVKTVSKKAVELQPYVKAAAWTAYGASYDMAQDAIHMAVKAVKAVKAWWEEEGEDMVVKAVANCIKGGIKAVNMARTTGIKAANFARNATKKAIEIAKKAISKKPADLPMTDEPAIIGTYVPSWEVCEW